jgi:integrase
MATFKKGNKKASRHRVGASIIKLKGKSGYYIRWYDRREDFRDFTVTATLPHKLSLKPAKQDGLQITKKPKKDVLLVNRVDVGDVILKAAGFPVNTVEEFNAQLKAFDGKQILIHVNKGGKTGTTPRFVKAGNTTVEARRSLNNLDNIKKKREEQKPKVNVVFSQLVNDFLDWAVTPTAGYAKSWLKDIKRIMKIHSERWGALPIEEITPLEIQRWINKRAVDVTASTLNNELSPLRKAFQLAVTQWDYLKEDPTRNISFRQPPASVPKYLSEEEVNTLLEIARAADNFRLNPVITSKGGIRKSMLGQTADELRTNRYNADGTFDTARISFLLLTALRKGQFIDLKWEQYNKKSGTITLQTTEEHSEKGRKVNVIPLPKKAKAIISGQPKNSEYIFPNLIGGRDEQIGRRMKKIFKKFEDETDKNMHLHILRHTALTQLLKYSGNIAAVSKYAGHSNIKTTEIYAHILDDQLKEITADFDFTSTRNDIDDAVQKK